MFAPMYNLKDVIFFPGRMRVGYVTDFFKKWISVAQNFVCLHSGVCISVSVVVMLWRGEVCAPGLTLQQHLDMTWGKHSTSGWSTEVA